MRNGKLLSRINNMGRPRLLLADDHTLVLEGFRRLLEPEFDLAGTVENGRALLSAAHRLRPDVVLMDISMPGLNGIEAAKRLRKTEPDTKIIFVTMHSDPAYVSEAFRAGASGYVLKRSAASELVTAIQEVLKGRSYVTPLVTKDVLHSFLEDPKPERPTGRLTSRQREVLQLIAEGHSNKEIATILNISPKTVEFHKSRIFAELGLRTTAELTQFALKHGIIG
jgi:DNA-binding NarL/FixJ family response regulator